MLLSLVITHFNLVKMLQNTSIILLYKCHISFQVSNHWTSGYEGPQSVRKSHQIYSNKTTLLSAYSELSSQSLSSSAGMCFIPPLADQVSLDWRTLDASWDESTDWDDGTAAGPLLELLTWSGLHDVESVLLAGSSGRSGSSTDGSSSCVNLHVRSASSCVTVSDKLVSGFHERGPSWYTVHVDRAIHCVKHGEPINNTRSNGQSSGQAGFASTRSWRRLWQWQPGTLRHAKLQSTHHHSHSDTKLYRLDDILLLKITESKQRRIENWM